MIETAQAEADEYSAEESLSPRALAAYDRSRHDPGRSTAWRLSWYFISLIIFESGWFPLSRLKCRLLRLFGAEVGEGVVVKPNVRIKYPWKLVLGDHAWIGQDAWIDNLATVKVGSNACISQSAYLCTGGHDYRTPEFDFIDHPIEIGEGVWLGARAILLPGAHVGKGSVVGAGSVVTRPIPSGVLVAGNPATMIRRLVATPRHPR